MCFMHQKEGRRGVKQAEGYFQVGGRAEANEPREYSPPPPPGQVGPPPSEVGPRSIKVRTCYLDPDIFLAFTSSEKLALFCLF